MMNLNRSLSEEDEEKVMITMILCLVNTHVAGTYLGFLNGMAHQQKLGHRLGRWCIVEKRARENVESCDVDMLYGCCAWL